MTLEIPKLSLVVLIGASCSGKSTFARRFFLPTEIVSSDACRGLVADDEGAQDASEDAFQLLHALARIRLRRGRLTVIDATNLRRADRQSLIDLARQNDVLLVAIVFDLPEPVLRARLAGRTDRNFGAPVLRKQVQLMRRELRGLERDGFHRVHWLASEAEVEAATVERVRVWPDRSDEHGPFDLIGDVHGCHRELVSLLGACGWTVTDGARPTASHPEGRRAVFVGDLVDRGPNTPEVLELVMNMVEDGTALCVPGNHDVKLAKKLRGRDVKLSHGLAESMAQLERRDDAFRTRVADFVDSLVSHVILDDGKLVVAHAGVKESYQGRASQRVRSFCLYGDTTGEIDAYGLPVRLDWAEGYRGAAMVVYGHTPVVRAEWVNRTIDLDTGCVFGGKLTALRYPELELVDVPALAVWYEPVRPLAGADDRAGTALLDRDDVSGKRQIGTELMGSIGIQPDQATAALEVMCRFAVDPRWLVYLPPTMSPCETAPEGAPELEHPREAFAYFRRQGVTSVVVEQKHMGSRAVLVVCRTPDVAMTRFGLPAPRPGVVLSRTGRPFFRDRATEEALLQRVAAAIAGAGLWDELATDWVVLDAELMPWSAKAQELLRSQYGPTGVSGAHVLGATADLLARVPAEPEVEALLARTVARKEAVDAYRDAWSRYCWTVSGLDDLRVAPFHLMASEGRVHTDRDHAWHMTVLERLAATGDPLLVATPWRRVDLADDDAVAGATAWWEAMTAAGSEGAVFKPLEWIGRGKKGLVQPALKVRGREYLRIIYGPEYTLPANLERLRPRGLGRKRSLALREFALGVEALRRFVAKEPLYRVHECVFGVLALETEPVDPRL